MNLRYGLPLAATLALVGPMGAASASSIYDARTLGMGGSSVGYSGNATLTYWNPAAAATAPRFGIYAPSLSLSLSNNLLSVNQALGLAQNIQGMLGGSSSSGGNNTAFGDIFNNLGSSNGLALRAESLVDVLGFSAGHVGPGNLAVRVYAHGVASAKMSLSQDFSKDLNGLFFQGGFTNITNTISKIANESNSSSGTNTDQLKADVATLKGQLNQYMSSFIKLNGEKSTVKNLDLDTNAGGDAALAATYAQPLPLRIAALPESQLTLGATGKVFFSPQQLLAGAIGSKLPDLPGATDNAKINPIGGMGTSVSLDVDKQVSDLVKAIDAFDKDQNLATSADLAAKTGAFFSDGLAKSKVAYTSTAANSPVGFGMDLGAAFRLNRQWSFGASLSNPLLVWGATKNTYKYDFSGDSIKVNKTSEATNNWAAEPMVARLGAAFQPEFAGPPVLAKGLLLSAGLDAPIIGGFGPTVSLGAEKAFGPFALRLGTEQGGLTPLYTGGFGFQGSLGHLDLGVGVNNPGDLKSAAVAFTWGGGF